MDHLTINKAKIIREQLMNELELYLEQKEINFIKTQPGSPVMRDIIEGKSLIETATDLSIDTDGCKKVLKYYQQYGKRRK